MEKLGKTNKWTGLIKSLHNNKKARERALHIVEGEHSVFEYLQHCPEKLKVIIINESRLNGPVHEKIILLMDKAKTSMPVYYADSKLFNALCSAKNLETCAAVSETGLKNQNDFIMDFKQKKIKKIIWLDSASNPSNTGALIRLARAMGVQAFVMTGNHVFPFSSHSVRASQGASAVVPLYSCCRNELIDLFNLSEFPCFITDVNKGFWPWECRFSDSWCFVFGSEANGLGPDFKKLLCKGLNIPMLNDCESLSIVQAASMILYEAVKQGLHGPDFK
jgi:tRNA G18 (ribose-2'-O)-methylase SpoU